MEANVKVEIHSPKDKVWQAITDIHNSASMITGILDIKVLHQPEQGLIGLKWQETRKIFGKEATETMWITECKESEYYYTRAENHGAIYKTKMAISEVAGTTQLSMSFSGTSESAVTRLISSIMGIFVKKSMVKMMQQDLNDIKTFVEQSS